MEIAVLRLLHIAGGVLWAGGAFLVGIFLIPSIQEAGPAGGAVMGGVVKRKLPVWMTVFALVSVLSGLRLLMIDSGSGSGYLMTPAGISIGIGALFALAGFILGVFVQRPIAEKMGKMTAAIQSAGGPPSAEQQAEMKRLSQAMGKVAKRNAILLLHAAIFMAGNRLIAQLFTPSV